MRIALSTTLLGSGYQSDGIATYTRELLSEFARNSTNDLKVTTVAFPPAVPWRKNDNAGEVSFDLSFHPSLMLSLATGLPFFGSHRISEQIDLFHSTDYRIPKLNGIPVVATLCDAILLKHPEWTKNRVVAALRARAMKLAARSATHVIAISHAAVDDLVECFGVDRDRISVVHLGVNPIWFEPIAPLQLSATKSRYGLPDSFVLFVGTLQPRKNLMALIRAHEMLPPDLRRNFPLVVVGRSGWAADSLVAQLHDLQRERLALWLDYVPFDDLRPLYHLASVFVLPSLYEGFGLPVLEAFASDVPVVASNTTSLPEVAGDAALLVDPQNPSAIAAAIERVVSGQVLANTLRERGRARVRDFSWQRCAQETLAVYRKALK